MVVLKSLTKATSIAVALLIGSASLGIAVIPGPRAYEGHVEQPASGWFASACDLPFRLMQRLKRGYYPGRSPNMQFVANAPSQPANSHSGPWDYLARVPLLFYGPGYIKDRGEVNIGRDVTVADMMPTYAELLGTSFPRDRAGKPLWRALVPKDNRKTPPRLIITVVWDGGGKAVLDAHQDSWPELESMIPGGTYFKGANTGASPTITPAVHATIGTGTFPNQHGVVDIKMKIDGQIQGAGEDGIPWTMLIKAFPEIYDQRMDNKPKVGVFAYKSWHTAMIGKGTKTLGGDRDLEALVDHDSRVFGNADVYTVPNYMDDMAELDRDIERLDIKDGDDDGKWLGNDVLKNKDLVRRTPAWTRYQTTLIKKLLRHEHYGQDAIPDLFFTNYKQIDEVSHHWSMLGAEMEDVLHVTDAQLPKLTSFLDDYVGKNKWVMAVTADHGPAPDVPANGGWRIGVEGFISDMAAFVGVPRRQMEVDHRSTGNWPKQATLDDKGLSMGDLANWIIDYRIKDNSNGSVPSEYETRKNEPVYSSAFPTTNLKKAWKCSRQGSTG